MLTCGISGVLNSIEALSGACTISSSVLKVLLVSGIAICADKGIADREINARTQHPPRLHIGEATPKLPNAPPRKGALARSDSSPPSFLVNLNLGFRRPLQSQALREASLSFMGTSVVTIRSRREFRSEMRGERGLSSGVPVSGKCQVLSVKKHSDLSKNK